MKILTIPTLASLAAVLAIGCASTPVPADKLANATAATRSAEEMQASRNPQAALHLKLAKEQLEEARKMLKDGDNEEATSMLLRAEADANASLGLAREHAARLDAQKTIDNVQQTKSQLSTPTAAAPAPATATEPATNQAKTANPAPAKDGVK